MYRDDHEAALARVTALEVELERARAEDDAQAQRLAKLEAELRAARSELGRTKAELERVRPGSTTAAEPQAADQAWPQPPPPGRATGVWAFTALVVISVVVGFAVVAIRSSRRAEEPRESVQVDLPQRAQPDDIAAMVEEAWTRAGRLLPGGALADIEAEGVTPEGTLHPQYGQLIVQFERENPPPPIDRSRPIGAPQPTSDVYRHECLLLMRSASAWQNDDGSTMPCVAPGRARSDRVPSCTMRTIWALAIRRGAPRDAIAKIHYSGSWYFSIHDPRVQFDATFDDSCLP